MAIMPDLRRLKYENEYFFHKGRYVTQQMLDQEERDRKNEIIMNDPTLTHAQKLQKILLKKY